MKIAILSDIHGNFDALSSFSETYDELWILGDLVNYGPQPAEVVDYVRAKATIVLKGNHDKAVAQGGDPHCVPPFREIAAESQKITESLLSPDQKAYLRTLPSSLRLTREQTSFFICHATPSNPLYGYCEADSAAWIHASAEVQADILLAGHTHVQFSRRIKDKIVANPGSLGLSMSGDRNGRYAVCEDGVLTLRTLPYPVEHTVRKLKSLTLSRPVSAKLIGLLENGAIS